MVEVLWRTEVKFYSWLGPECPGTKRGLSNSLTLGSRHVFDTSNKNIVCTGMTTQEPWYIFDPSQERDK